MAISADKAREVAKRRLGSANITLSETSTEYVAAINRKRGEERPGEMPIAINKSTGKVKNVLLPSKEGFELISSARPVKTRSGGRKK